MQDIKHGMSIYSIKDLEHLSGIKAHTIRIWEQRYDLFSPQRTATNIRFYDENDLKLILNIASLKDHGYKISKIVNMSPQSIFDEITRINQSSDSYKDQISALTIAMIDLDEELFSDVLSRNIEKYGFEKTMMDITYPFMRSIGTLWLTNTINPAQEHFVSHLVRQKLIAATDSLKVKESSPLFLLFLPEGELHELGILFANYMLRNAGFRTIFFGQSVPLDALEEVFYRLEPAYLLTAMTTSPDPSEVQEYIDSLGKKFSKVQILITGSMIINGNIKLKDNFTLIHHLGELDDILLKIKEKVSITY